MNKLTVGYQPDNVGATHLFDQNGNLDLLSTPQGLAVIDGYTDFISWHRNAFCRTYILGGHTANVMLTETEALLRMFIRAPSCPMVNSAVPTNNQCGVVAAAGPGLTGSCRFALRWFDSIHNRRSPLSAASPAIVLANQGVTFYNAPLVPMPDDAYVDQLEIWVSVDGGLFRNLDWMDIGVATFDTNETATGEAYSTTLIEMPIVKFGDIANDRLFGAGNPEFPDRVFVSEVSAPEEYSGVYIPTRNGEPVIGLKNIGGTIYVQCVGASYYIQGFGPSDFTMRPLQPKIGGYGQKSIMMLNDFALIPAQQQWYVCNGTSLTPIGIGEWNLTWRDTVSDDTKQSCYEDGIAVTDLVSGVLKFLPRAPRTGESQMPDIIQFPNETTAVNNYWVIGSAAIDRGSAPLSFDQVNGGVHTAIAMLYDPDAAIGALYTGTADGDILLENQPGRVDRQTIAAVETKIPLQCLIHTQHQKIADAFQDDDGSQVTDVLAIYQCENLPTTIDVFAGNEWAWQSAVLGGSTPVGTESFNIPIGSDFPSGGIVNCFVPRDRVLISSLQKGGGTSVSLRLTLNQTDDQTRDQVILGAALQKAEFVFTGWGFVAQAGLDKRPLGPFYS